MADFGFLSDTDDSAVEELISQAQELSVLEQISKINCSGLTDSVLPTDLETRFHRLKSFPLSSKPKNAPILTKSKTDLNSGSSSLKGPINGGGSLSDSESGGFLKGKNESCFDQKRSPERKLETERELKSGYVSSPSNSALEEEIFSPKKENPDGKGDFKKKSLHGSVSSPSDSPNSCDSENVIFSPSKLKSDKKKGLNSKAKSRSFRSPLGSSNSLMDSPSPPKKVGCFWCSPKKGSKEKSQERLGLDWGNDNIDDFLSDLSTFSVKEQQKRLKKAMKEQEKISKEAEKIVKWAKQASARMSFHGFEDELSDDEIAK